MKKSSGGRLEVLFLKGEGTKYPGDDRSMLNPPVGRGRPVVIVHDCMTD